MGNPSKVLKCRAFRWDGVELKAYKRADAPYKEVTRQTLLGEGPGEEVFRFITRYFEVQPGGYSTLELHQHPHAVVILRGSGQVVLGDDTREVADTKHQFRASGTEPLGFLCVVDRIRDRPQVVG